MRLSRLRALSALALAAALVPVTSPAGAQNIALGKNAFQSSDYDPSYSYAAKAVDGNTQGNYFVSPGVTATQFNFNGWWYVDLGGSYNIATITLWNRTDCCGNRLADFFVSVLAAGTPNVSDINAPTVWTQLFSGQAGVTEVFLPGGALGQYVKVQYDNHADYLQLAEVEVIAGGVTVTPEPASLLLVASGLLAFGGVAARRRKIS